MNDDRLNEKQVRKIIEDAIEDQRIMEGKDITNLIEKLVGELNVMDISSIYIILGRLEEEKKIEKRIYYCAIEKEKKS